MDLTQFLLITLSPLLGHLIGVIVALWWIKKQDERDRK